MRDDEFINVKDMFRGTEPDQVLQNAVTGESNIERAEFAYMVYYQTMHKAMNWKKWDLKLDDAIMAFNEQSTYIQAYAKYGTWYSELLKTIIADIKYALSAVCLISTYLIIFLGSISPLHTRLTVAILGLVCVGIACAAGFGICLNSGWYFTEMTNVLPTIMLGIGVDDMFVICNSVDQQPYHLTAKERIRRAMMHAGPSITITSFTDCVAFIIGARSSILALRAFGIYASVTVLMLYLSQVTIFLCLVAWDAKRVEYGVHECCYLCFCNEDSFLFCRGKYMTPN